MTLKHSPGPWKATGNGVHTGIDCVATTHAEPQEQRQIDARLIAAAPDMLRVLRVLVPMSISGAEDREGWMAWNAALNEASELIAKLDGDTCPGT